MIRFSKGVSNRAHCETYTMSGFGIKQVYHFSVLGCFMCFDVKLLFILMRFLQVDFYNGSHFYTIPQFATMWSQFVVQDYFILSCLEDVLELTPKSSLSGFKKLLTNHANDLLIYVTLPFTMAVCVDFWVFYTANPRTLDEFNIIYVVMDPQSNHMVHTLVIPILLIEMTITCRRYPPTWTMAHLCWKIIPFPVTYYITVYGMKLLSPVWPYPLFKAMSLLQWICFLGINLMLYYMYYTAGYFYNAFIWGKNNEATGKPASRAKPWKYSASYWEVSRLIQVAQGR